MPLSVTALDDRTLTGLLVGLVVLGIALIVANLPGSPIREGSLEMFGILGLPIIIALVAYVRFTPIIEWWELSLLFGWAFLAMVISAFVGFLATMGSPAGIPGVLGEFLRDGAMFLAGCIGLGVPYALVGRLRDERPRMAILVALLSPISLFVLFMIAATSL